MKEIAPAELKQRLDQGEALILLDVREAYEHEEFNIGGANIPLTELPFRIEELRALGDGDIVLYCQSGKRSGLAQLLLQNQFQVTQTLSLVGGLAAWKEM